MQKVLQGFIEWRQAEHSSLQFNIVGSIKSNSAGKEMNHCKTICRGRQCRNPALKNRKKQKTKNPNSKTDINGCGEDQKSRTRGTQKQVKSKPLMSCCKCQKIQAGNKQKSNCEHREPGNESAKNTGEIRPTTMSKQGPQNFQKHQMLQKTGRKNSKHHNHLPKLLGSLGLVFRSCVDKLNRSP